MKSQVHRSTSGPFRSADEEEGTFQNPALEHLLIQVDDMNIYIFVYVFASVVFVNVQGDDAPHMTLPKASFIQLILLGERKYTRIVQLAFGNYEPPLPLPPC